MARSALIVLTLIGTALSARMAALYAGHDALALTLVTAITAGLWWGALEQWRRIQNAAAMLAELQALPRPATAAVVENASPALRPILAAVEAGQSPPPPTAQFTPFLLGLLVMLGMLGTFLGLVDTLSGAGALMAGAQDADALRKGLGGPISGLTRAFGTSVAGVGASAALGLASVFVRRAERTARRLAVQYAAGPMRALTPLGRQLAALEALSSHFEALPRAADALNAAVDNIDQLAQTLGTAQREGLETAAQTLGKRLDAAAKATRESVKSIAEAAVAGASEAASTHLQTVVVALGTAETARAEAFEAQTLKLVDHLSAQQAARDAAAAENETERLARLDTGFEALSGRLETLADGLQKADAERSATASARLDLWRADVAAVFERLERTEAAHTEATQAVLDAMSQDAKRRRDEERARIDALLERLDGHEGRRAEREAARRAEETGHVDAVLDRLSTFDSQLSTSAQSTVSTVLTSLQRDAEQQAAERTAGFERLSSQFDSMLRALAEQEVKREKQHAAAALELQQVLAWQAESQATAQTRQLEAVTQGFERLSDKLDETESQRASGQLEHLGRILERLEAGERERAEQARQRDQAAQLAFAQLTERVAGAESQQAQTVTELMQRVADAEAEWLRAHREAVAKIEGDAESRHGSRASQDAARFEALSARLDAALKHIEAGEGQRLKTVQSLVVALDERAADAEAAREARASALDARLESFAATMQAEAQRNAEAEARRLAALEARWAALSEATEAGAERIARQTEAALSALRAPLAQLGAEARTAARALADAEQKRAAELGVRLDEIATGVRQRLAESAQQETERLAQFGAQLVAVQTQIEATSEAGPKAAAALMTQAAEQLQAERELAGRRDATLGELIHELRAAGAQLGDAGTAQIAAAAAAEQAATQRLDALTQAAQAALTQQTERMAVVESRLSEAHTEQQQQLALRLSAHASDVSERLEASTAVIGEAAQLLRAGGGELSAVAELFSDAVDAWRSHSERMLTTLGELESTLGDTGREDAEQLVGEYVDQTREVFGDAMRFQRELFTELRALRRQEAE